MPIFRLIVVVLFLSPCLLTAGELSKEFQEYNPKIEFDPATGASKGARPFTPGRRETEITEIAFERTGCLGNCPAYTVKLFSNGKVSYQGTAHVERQGSFSAKISEGVFDNLVEFSQTIDFRAFLPSYEVMVTCHPTTYTKITYVDGTSKIVSNYANSAPIMLWALETLIDDAVSKATDWKQLPEVEKKSSKSTESIRRSRTKASAI